MILFSWLWMFASVQNEALRGKRSLSFGILKNFLNFAGSGICHIWLNTVCVCSFCSQTVWTQRFVDVRGELLNLVRWSSSCSCDHSFLFSSLLISLWVDLFLMPLQQKTKTILFHLSNIYSVLRLSLFTLPQQSEVKEEMHLCSNVKRVYKT